MMLLFSSAYQHLLSRSQTSCCFPSVYNFPIHLHTCFLIYIDEKIQYYAINLSWSNVQFWLPTILIFFAQYVMNDNLIEREFLCQRGLCYKLQLPSFCAKWRLLCLLSFKYFSTHGKNFYEQLTVYGVGGLLYSVLWNDFMSKRNMFLLL